jgi:hypothetical protein
MDGACTTPPATCTSTLTYPQYTYAPVADVQPYFNIAQQYGYANYFFQTSQGPSFPAHQFLFSGTSAPIYNDGDSNQYWKWFVAENATDYLHEFDYGCTSQDTLVLQVDPGGIESNGYGGGLPCYDHNTLESLLDSPTHPISWKYYAQGTSLGTSPGNDSLDRAQRH